VTGLRLPAVDAIDGQVRALSEALLVNLEQAGIVRRQAGVGGLDVVLTQEKFVWLLSWLEGAAAAAEADGRARRVEPIVDALLDDLGALRDQPDGDRLDVGHLATSWERLHPGARKRIRARWIALAAGKSR
jgi:hypothetical protein